MDYMLDIILLRKELNKSGLSEVLKEWGGVKFSDDPALFVTDSGIEFGEVGDMSYYNRITGINFKSNTIGLHLKSDVLYDFEYSANKDIKNNDLLVFLKGLSRLSEFYILLRREDEKIKERYEIITPEEIECELFKCVNWSLPKDVLLYKKR